VVVDAEHQRGLPRRVGGRLPVRGDQGRLPLATVADSRVNSRPAPKPAAGVPVELWLMVTDVGHGVGHGVLSGRPSAGGCHPGRAVVDQQAGRAVDQGDDPAGRQVQGVGQACRQVPIDDRPVVRGLHSFYCLLKGRVAPALRLSVTAGEPRCRSLLIESMS